MTMNSIFTKYLYGSLLSMSIIVFGCSGESEVIDDPRPSFFSTLSDIDDLIITIETDYNLLLQNKEVEDNLYQDAQLTAQSSQGDPLNIAVQIRSRGVTRKSLCDFPPIMIKIQKEERSQLDVKKTDNLKMVSFCKGDPGFQNLVAKEYLIYKLYNVLTDTSYNVKLANLNVKDTIGSVYVSDQIAFLIEPTDDMASRLGCTYNEEDVSPVKRIHKEQYKNFVVFQYMVGNTDWNLSGRHNIRMLDCNSELGPKPVPYDFDYSGLVNATYAKPHPMLPIKKVTERLFQFRGSVEEDFSQTYALFNAKKSTFYSTVQDFPYLDEDTKLNMIAYLDGFYENISSDETMMAEMMKVRKKKS